MNAQQFRARLAALNLSTRAAAEAIGVTERRLRGLASGKYEITRLVEMALAGVEAGREWRPINTAPRDGTKVQLADMATGRWSRLAGIGEMWETDDAWVEEQDFTHWRPLPAPPAVAEEREG